MAFDTYSFSDINCILSLAGFPAITINGQGIGSVTIDWADDNTAHDKSADGRYMVSKMLGDGGTVAIETQQVSALNAILRRAYNTLKVADSTLWASGTLSLTTVHAPFENIFVSGLSFTKRASRPYQIQGQMITWNFMATSMNDLI